MTARRIFTLDAATPQLRVPATGDTYSAPVTLQAATGNEVAYTFEYTVNKATSGNDTGLLVNQIDSASPGVSLLADFQVGGASKFRFGAAGVFSCYNTYTDDSNYERGFLKWNSNILEIGVDAAGTGTSREVKYYTDSSRAIKKSGASISFADYSGVTWVGSHALASSGINFIAASAVKIGGTVNSDIAPQGVTLSGADARSTAVTNISGGDLYVFGGGGASGSAGNAHGGNVHVRGGEAFGTGVDGDVYIGDANTVGIGFFDATPVSQQSGTGETTGFTAGSGTAVNDDSTFTGNVGSTAYRINDVVKALKNYGLLAS